MENKKEILSVVYSCDNNYVQHMGVSLYSLLKNNYQFKQIRVFVIEHKVSIENKKKIEKIISEFFYAQINWIVLDEWINKLKLNMLWEISLSAYARLFIASMVPSELERILYLDCDTIICGDLSDLWISDLQGNIIGAVQDAVNRKVKEAVEVRPTEKYFNSGVLLINLKLWRDNLIEEKCFEFVCNKDGRVLHHDQGILNGVLKGKTLFLPLMYNVMTIHYMFNRKKLMKYYEEEAGFYSEQEIRQAKENPVVLHYTPSFTCRPWIRGCKHPLKEYYWNNLKNTPWKTSKAEKNRNVWYVRLIEWRYRWFYW